MPEPDLIELFVRPLERLEFRYLISDSVAAMLYGEPRVPHDIDFVIFLRTQDFARLPEAYPPLGLNVVGTQGQKRSRSHSLS